MKHFIIALGGLLLPFFASAQGMQSGMEDSGLGLNEFKEFLPFVHVTEGHWPLVIMSIILWASFIYTAYSIFKKLIKNQ